MRVRPATTSDEPFLREMLAEAADWRAGSTVRSGDQVMADPDVAHYLSGWVRDGDFGAVAEDVGRPIGAAWCRRFASAPRGYGFLATNVPELTIGVTADRRGQGVGRLLLSDVIRQARQRPHIDRISLSVEADNPALELYRSMGFVQVAGTADAPTMALDLAG